MSADGGDRLRPCREHPAEAGSIIWRKAADVFHTVPNAAARMIALGALTAPVQADDAGSLTLQVWDMNTVRVQFASRRGTVTLAPVLRPP